MTTQTWLSTSLHRQFPLGQPARRRTLAIPAARGERVSFQVCARVEQAEPVEVAAKASAPADVAVIIRRVGRVPVPHHNTGTPTEELDGVGHIPGYVPDPLFPEAATRVAPGEVQAFWITVAVPREAAPGPKEIRVELTVGGEATPPLTATVEVSDVVLAERGDFRVTHWFYADALCDRYRVEPFEEAFWPVCAAYMRDYAEHGCDSIYVPAFTPPLDGVKRPTQLLEVARPRKGRYAFDWTQVARWVAQAQACGIRHFEWTHLFTQWGVKHAIRVYDPKGGLLWDPATEATSETYRGFLSQYLPALERFLREQKLLDRSFFHISDEPHGDEHLANYRKARAMVGELAPWMKVMDALSDIRFAREGLVDIPVPSISTTRQFAEEGIPSWTYFCCGPRGRYLNRLLDTPLAKLRMAGWLFYRFGCLGFLHWGYNYWYKSQTQQMIDPFTVTDGLAWPGWAYGDTFQVYPGECGPIDSIRWEVFAESLQDYALLQTLGVERDGALLAPLKDFDDFPKDERWIRAARRRLLCGRA
jgi:hypothetical protein